MKKFLTYFIFIIASLAIIAAFATAVNYTQLIIAILFFPLYAYIALEIYPLGTLLRKNASQPARTVPPKRAGVREEPQHGNIEEATVVDIDKRAFLKLIGAAGLSVFFASIFYKRAQAILFGSESGTVTIQDAAGHTINPVEGQPTDGYKIAEIDDSIIAYYGFSDKNGAWYILRQDTENGTFRYTKGGSDFAGNWAKRDRQKYDYFNNVFK